MNADKKLVSWLQDFYAIKEHTESALQKYAASVEDYPVLAAKLNAHLTQTRRHKEQIEATLKSLGASYSGFGSTVARILGAGQTAASSLLGDAVLTNAAATTALEELEVATLAAIATAAERAGQKNFGQIAGEIMAQDSAMVTWMQGHIPQLTREYLDRLARG